MEVIRLNPSHRKPAAQVLARAFFDYPMTAYYWPDLNRRIRYLEWYWGCAVNYGLRYADAQGLPCYLETYEKRNIPFYLRRGFNLVRTEQVPNSDLCFWCFRREPHANHHL
jgi:hypothetical protein